MTCPILVDADACPVKEEIYKTAYRRKTPVVLVANRYMRTPEHPLISLQMVSEAFDAADDWIAEQATARHLVITADILLAQRCLNAGATVLSPTGKPFDHNNIGAAVATRALMADLRAEVSKPSSSAATTSALTAPPFSAKDRANFLNALDRTLTRLERTRTQNPPA